MPKSRVSVQLSANTVDQLRTELQFILQQMSDRIDKLEGVRGTPAFQSEATFNGDVIANGTDVIVKDSNGNKIHSME